PRAGSADVRPDPDRGPPARLDELYRPLFPAGHAPLGALGKPYLELAGAVRLLDGPCRRAGAGDRGQSKAVSAPGIISGGHLSVIAAVVRRQWPGFGARAGAVAGLCGRSALADSRITPPYARRLPRANRLRLARFRPGRGGPRGPVLRRLQENRPVRPQSLGHAQDGRRIPQHELRPSRCSAVALFLLGASGPAPAQCGRAHPNWVAVSRRTSSRAGIAPVPGWHDRARPRPWLGTYQPGRAHRLRFPLRHPGRADVVCWVFHLGRLPYRAARRVDADGASHAHLRGAYAQHEGRPHTRPRAPPKDAYL